MLRLLIDENIDHRILRGLLSRLPQVDYVLVKQIGMSGSPDLDYSDGQPGKKGLSSLMTKRR